MTPLGDTHRQLLERVPAWAMVRSLLLTLNRAGYRSYLVGGVVRDLMLGETPEDMDILTSAGPNEIRSLFPDRKVRLVGSSFTVTLVDGVEVASCRVCPEGLPGKLTDRFPASDLAHRDLTINSMAWDPFTGEVLDPFGGEKDLSHRIIRFTRNPSSRIEEDPLRMVRACRFAAALGGGDIEADSLKAIAVHRKLLLTQAAPERIRAELLKAMSMDCPSRFFTLLHNTGLLPLILPCLDRCWDLDGGPNHGETVFEHCMLVGNALPGKRPLLRLAGFLHDVGKYDAAERKNGELAFHGHETHDAAIARDLAALRFSNRETAFILSLVRAHMRPLNQNATPRAVRRLLAMLDGLGLDYRDFMRLRIADKGGNLAKPPYTLSQLKVRLGKILAELKAGNAFKQTDLAITGREICSLLNLTPGPRVGQIKDYLYEKILREPSLNTPDRLADLVRKFRP